MLGLQNLKKKVRSVKSNTQQDTFDGVGVTLLLLLVLVAIIANIVRVIDNGLTNYNVYLEEQAALTEEKARRQRLQEDLEYYQSADAKELLARDVLGVARPNEQLFRREEETVFYTVETKTIDAAKIEEKKDLWRLLMGIFK